MKLFEKFNGVFLFAGFILFVGATVSLGIIPAVMVDDVHPKQGLPTEVPEEFADVYKTAEEYQAGLLLGRDVYVAEACWHCHSQYVRPVSNEAIYYGPVPSPAEYQTVLHRPQLLGTRRVGPDLSRAATLHSNDWHYAHLYEPTSVVPDSIMPSYKWLFKEVDGKIVPTEEGIGLVAYLQSLGAPIMKAVIENRQKDVIRPPRYEGL